jgi:hypothetical protein
MRFTRRRLFSCGAEERLDDVARLQPQKNLLDKLDVSFIVVRVSPEFDGIVMLPNTVRQDQEYR